MTSLLWSTTVGDWCIQVAHLTLIILPGMMVFFASPIEYLIDYGCLLFLLNPSLFLIFTFIIAESGLPILRIFPPDEILVQTFAKGSFHGNFLFWFIFFPPFSLFVGHKEAADIIEIGVKVIVVGCQLNFHIVRFLNCIFFLHHNIPSFLYVQFLAMTL